MADGKHGPRPNPLWQLTLVRMKEFVREPEAVFWVFVFPVLLAFALGIAFRNRPPEQSVVKVDESSLNAERVHKMLSSSPELRVETLAEGEAKTALRLGDADLVVRREPAAEAEGEVYTFIYDPTRSSSRLARLVSADALQRELGRKDEAEIREALMIEPGARYIDFLIPGLIGLNLMGSGMWGVGFNVVQARTRKLLKRMVATPMRRSHFLLSYMLSRLLFLVLEVAALVGFGWLAFGVRVEGSILALGVVSLLGALAFAGLGLLVASRPKTIEAISGWINFVMLPMWILSGSFFPYSRFPEFTHPFIRALPLTALNDALRAVINQGLPLWTAWQEIVIISLWGILSFVVALRIFRWQ